MRKKNLKELAKRVHGKNVHPLGEASQFWTTKTMLWEKTSSGNEQNENIRKKINLVVDLNNSTDL